MALKKITQSILFYGDNLSILREHFEDESVDLIYLDPPFNSSRSYNVLFKNEAGQEAESQIHAFEDTWHWNIKTAEAYKELLMKSDKNISDLMGAFYQFLGPNQMTAYLVMMASRVIELHRVLRATGSFYLHCDPTASHYLKILVDTVFDVRNFKNEIIWRRTGAHGPRRSFGPIHDVILFYSKSPDYYFNIVKHPYMKGHVTSRYAPDETGRLRFVSGGNILTGSGVTSGESGATWKGFNPSAKNRHWAVPGFLAEKMSPEFEELGVLAKLDALHNAGLIVITEGNEWPVPLRYLDEDDGQPLQDIWAYQPYTEGTVYGTEDGIDKDVSWLGPTDPERLGYQTQKPEGLLERIINSSCPPGGVVLDPFCGCGTTIAAAQRLGRTWVGIDITNLAISLQKHRLTTFKVVENKDYIVMGEPEDLESAKELAFEDRYQFQWWACSLVSAKPLGGDGGKQGKKGSDKGVDGLLRFIDEADNRVKNVIVQVKSGKVKSGDIRDLIGALNNSKAVMGVFITLEEPSQPMIDAAVAQGFYSSKVWNKDYPKIQILTIEALLNGAEVSMPPATIPLYKKNKAGENAGQLDLM